MLRKIYVLLWRASLVHALITLSSLALPKIAVQFYAIPRTFQLKSVPLAPVALVFGAGLLHDGSAGPVLRDRVETAVQLYQAGKVKKLLMSGDNRFVEYNEPEAMRQYAIKLGVPDSDIVLDYAGRRTYDTCYRAKAIFQVQAAVLVTQPFHMPRALFLCNQMGLNAAGVEANNAYFRKVSRTYWNLRELPATTQAVWEIFISKPIPVLGQPEPIP